MEALNDLQIFLEKIDSYRDKALFIFIKPYWPRRITPNQITSIRIAIGVLLFVLLFFFSIENRALIMWLFIVGVLTDFLDGPVARGTNKVTELGAMLDSTADRILIVPIAFYSLFNLHRWLLLTLILAEIINTIFSIWYKSKDIYYESNIFGKVKMTLLSIVFVAILIVWPRLPPQLFIYFLWLTVPFSFLSIFSKVLELNAKGHIKNKIIAKQIDKYTNI